MDEWCLEQLQNVSKTFHPHYLAIYLPIRHYGGGLRYSRRGRRSGCGFHIGGWGDKSLNKVDERFLKHFPIVSNTFLPLYPAIYRCLDTLHQNPYLEPSGGTQEAPRRHPGGTQEAPRGTKGSRGHLEARSHKQLSPYQTDCKSSLTTKICWLRTFKGRYHQVF